MDNFVEEILLTHEQIVEIGKRLGKQITEDYQGKKPVLVGLLKGSVPFLAELIKHVKCEMELDFMQVSSYNGTSSTGTVVLKKDLSDNIEDRHIILVEDIVDTGLTIKEVINVLKDRKVASIEIVTMLDKPEGRTVDGITPKYIGESIPNKFVIGFGLDYDGIYRNLDYVGVLKKSIYQK